MPAVFYGKNPIEVSSEQSVYITAEAGLEKEQHRVPALYADFFKQAEARLRLLSASVKNKAFSEWLGRLAPVPCILEVHDYEAFFEGEKSSWFIRFPEKEMKGADEYFNHPDALSLELTDADTAHLPQPLRELYQLGILYFYGYLSAGYFYHPRNIKKAVDEEFLSDYIQDEVYKSMNYPVSELMVFFADLHGSFLMYDADGRVYAAGSDFYRSSKNLDEVITILFTSLLKGERRLNVERIAPVQ